MKVRYLALSLAAVSLLAAGCSKQTAQQNGQTIDSSGAMDNGSAMPSGMMMTPTPSGDMMSPTPTQSMMMTPTPSSASQNSAMPSPTPTGDMMHSGEMTPTPTPANW